LSRRRSANMAWLEKPVAVERLPGFRRRPGFGAGSGRANGGELLDPAPGSRVLDACAAPGGKTAHLLERARYSTCWPSTSSRRVAGALRPKPGPPWPAGRGQGRRLRQTDHLVGRSSLRRRAGRCAVYRQRRRAPQPGQPNGCAAKPTSPVLPPLRRAFSTRCGRSCGPGVNCSMQPARYFPAENGGRSKNSSPASRRPDAATRNSFYRLPNMMVFSTACSKSVAERLRRWLLLLAFVPALAWAAEKSRSPTRSCRPVTMVMCCRRFQVRTESAPRRRGHQGLMLHFVADFELTKGALVLA
jgi:hypothetical protein